MRPEFKWLVKEYKYHPENEGIVYYSLKSIKGLHILPFFINRSQLKKKKNQKSVHILANF